ncbi:MAG: helix-turn-helix transcriptional regulator [Flavobacterium sp.]|nr:helix-turn-helix transcriptional regulator [Flavobacterium sp.]
MCSTTTQSIDLSQKDLANALDISRLTIVKLENGKNVNIDTLLKIANHFDGLQTIYQLIKQDIDKNNRSSLY